MGERILSSDDLKRLINKFIQESIDESTLSTTGYKHYYRSKRLKIKVSFGQGQHSKVSWMAFLNLKEDQEVSRGIYPVILFDRDSCLVLAYGVSEENEPDIHWGKHIEDNFRKIGEINNSSCGCDISTIKQKYPNSYLKKCYKIKTEDKRLDDNSLDDLVNTLDEMIDYYISMNTSESVQPSTCLRNTTLRLDPHIINSFYNSLKTKGFVILAGPSGTGKTKIFEEFVKCFPLNREHGVEKWVVVEETGEKLLPIEKEEIEFNGGRIRIEYFIEAINESLGSETDRKVCLKIRSYYTELVPIIEELRNKTSLINATEINNHLAAYIGSLFGFKIIEKEDINRLSLTRLDKKLVIKEYTESFKNHLFFPIRPDFRDTKSLLGFYNPLKGQYHSTPLLDFILEASRNYLDKGREADPFFILFDEMNLARVEYYFADFLSIMEVKKFENKAEALENSSFKEFLDALGKDISVLNDNNDNCRFTSQSIKLHNERGVAEIPQDLFLPPNLYFVGTVNIDETTHMFSPKVLDRAFTIEFNVGEFTEYSNFLRSSGRDVSVSELAEEVKEQLKRDFIKNGDFAFINKENIKDFVSTNENFVGKLENINKILRRYNLHFGYRVFDEIMMFLYNSRNSFDNLSEAFDLAIKMKILPRFYGTRQKLEEPIIELLKQLELNRAGSGNHNEQNTNQEDLIEQIAGNLDGIPNIVEGTLEIENLAIETPYLHTTHKLLEMLYKLKTEGFASFM